MTVIVSSGSMYENIAVDAIHSDVNFVFDCRLLPDPYTDEKLRNFNGLDWRIANWFKNREDGSDRLIMGMVGLAREIVRHALSKESEYEAIEIACGCTGGHHRSPCVAHMIAEMVRREFSGLAVEEVHSCI